MNITNIMNIMNNINIINIMNIIKILNIMNTINTAVWGINETCPVTVEILFEKNLPSLMIYVHKNQCQLFHISNGMIWLTNWITLVHLNSFRPINLFLHLICVSFKNTLYITNTLSGVLAVSWGPEILI